MNMRLRGVACAVGVIKLVKDLVAHAEKTGCYLLGNGKLFKNVE